MLQTVLFLLLLAILAAVLDRYTIAIVLLAIAVSFLTVKGQLWDKLGEK